MIWFWWLMVASVGPALFWLRYFLRKDRLRPEPRWLLIKLFVWWLVLVVPAAVIELAIPSTEFIMLVVVAPIVEELLKIFTTWKLTQWDKAFDEPIDGIMYACAVALGFAALENIFYLWEAANAGNVTTVFFIRALLTVPGHALFTSMAWYALWLYTCVPKYKNKKILIVWIGLAILMHGLFNFLVATSLLTAWGLVVFIPFLRWLFHRKVKHSMRVHSE